MFRKHIDKKEKRYRHVLGIAAATFLLLGVSVSGTLAYLVTMSEPMTNSFSPARVECSVEKNLNENSIVVRNTGEAVIYIRVALVSATTDEDGNLSMDMNGNLNGINLGEGWKYMNGYYYYRYSVEPSASTRNLLGQTITLGENQSITVLAQCIQAEPSSAMKDAWGIDADSL